MDVETDGGGHQGEPTDDDPPPMAVLCPRCELTDGGPHPPGTLPENNRHCQSASSFPSDTLMTVYQPRQLLQKHNNMITIWLSMLLTQPAIQWNNSIRCPSKYLPHAQVPYLVTLVDLTYFVFEMGNE